MKLNLDDFKRKPTESMLDCAWMINNFTELPIPNTDSYDAISKYISDNLEQSKQRHLNNVYNLYVHEKQRQQHYKEISELHCKKYSKYDNNLHSRWKPICQEDIEW